MQPQNTSWWASQRAVERRRMKPWASRWVATSDGQRGQRCGPCADRNASQPRRFSIAVGGRRSHTEYR